MSTKRIPIAVAKRIAKEHGQSIVCLVTWEHETGLQHVVTFGKTKQECEWAAMLGNQIKEKILKWPQEQCNAQPARTVSKLSLSMAPTATDRARDLVKGLAGLGSASREQQIRFVANWLTLTFGKPPPIRIRLSGIQPPLTKEQRHEKTEALISQVMAEWGWSAISDPRDMGRLAYEVEIRGGGQLLSGEVTAAVLQRDTSRLLSGSVKKQKSARKKQA